MGLQIVQFLITLVEHPKKASISGPMKLHGGKCVHWTPPPIVVFYPGIHSRLPTMAFFDVQNFSQRFPLTQMVAVTNTIVAQSQDCATIVCNFQIAQITHAHYS